MGKIIKGHKEFIADVIKKEFRYSPAWKAASRLWYAGIREADICRAFDLMIPNTIGVDSAHLLNTRNELRDIERGFSKPIKESEL